MSNVAKIQEGFDNLASQLSSQEMAIPQTHAEVQCLSGMVGTLKKSVNAYESEHGKMKVALNLTIRALLGVRYPV